MTHLNGLAYLLGIQGAALLRGIREGTADRAAVDRRLAEIRALLDDPDLAADPGVTAHPGTYSTADMYRDWAPHYDTPNTMIEVEEPRVRAVLEKLPVGTALDAACGTGRLSALLDSLGHRVIGVDGSPAMLARARTRLPAAEFHLADLSTPPLPLPDDSVDTVVSGLALAHLPDLAPAMSEFARVLRPGGHLVVSDPHQLLSYIRPTLPRHRADDPDGPPGILEEYHRPLSAYLQAALPLGFQVRHCEEIHRARNRTDPDTAPDPLPTRVSWEILARCPEAAEIAMGVPAVVLWHFQLDG